MNFERKLILRRISATTEEVIVIQIGMPYFPARMAGMSQFYACIVDFGNQSGLPHEAFGIDAMQALGSALCSAHLFLKSLAETGELFWEDGKAYDPEVHGPVPYELQERIAKSRLAMSTNRANCKKSGDSGTDLASDSGMDHE